MVRRSKSPDLIDPENPKRRRGARARLEIEGTPEEVEQRIRGVTNGNPKADPSRQAEFIESLADARYLAIVERDDPVVFEGVPCEVEVKRFKLPRTYQDIVDYVTKNHGGKHYRITVINPRNGDVISASTFDVPGDPILPEPVVSDPGAQEMFDQARFQEETDPLAALEHQTLLTQRELNLERIRQQLAELRNTKQAGRGDPQMDRKIQDLERKQIDLEWEAKIRERDAKIQALEAQSAKPANGQSDLALLLAQMREDRKSADERFNQLLNQMRQDKMDTVLQEVKALRNRPEASNLKDNIAMLKDVAGMLGVDLAGSKDDDDEPKEWYEILIEKGIPMLQDLIDDNKKKGKVTTKEELSAEFNKIADRAAAEAVERVKAQAKPLPPPPPAVATIPQAAPVPIAQATAGTNPVAAPTANQPVSPPPSALPVIDTATSNPTPPTPQRIPTIEEEKSIRAAQVMSVLGREVELRPKDYMWNYAAWKTLPEDLLEQFCAAPDVVMMLGVFDPLPGFNVEALGQVKEKIKGSERIFAWMTRGLKELKEWWAKSLEDPGFDPDDEDEDEAEDQEGG